MPQAASLWDTPTQPDIHATDLPACKGACRQGRDACCHPLACSGVEAPALTPMRIDLHRVELANGSTVSDPDAEPDLSMAMRLVLRVAALAVVCATAWAVLL